MALAALPHDVIAKIVEAVAPASSPWKALTREAYALSCTCKELRAALAAWAQPIAAEMVNKMVGRRSVLWASECLPLPRPLQLVCREAMAVRGVLDVPYQWFAPDKIPLFDLDDSVAVSLLGQSALAGHECRGRSWHDWDDRDWVVSVRRRSCDVLIWRSPLCMRHGDPPVVLYVRVAVLNAAGDEVRALRLERRVHVLPNVPAGALVVGKCMHKKMSGTEAQRALTRSELAGLKLRRPNKAVRFEFYVVEVDPKRRWGGVGAE